MSTPPSDGGTVPAACALALDAVRQAVEGGAAPYPQLFVGYACNSAAFTGPADADPIIKNHSAKLVKLYDSTDARGGFVTDRGGRWPRANDVPQLLGGRRFVVTASQLCTKEFETATPEECQLPSVGTFLLPMEHMRLVLTAKCESEACRSAVMDPGVMFLKPDGSAPGSLRWTPRTTWRWASRALFDAAREGRTKFAVKPAGGEGPLIYKADGSDPLLSTSDERDAIDNIVSGVDMPTGCTEAGTSVNGMGVGLDIKLLGAAHYDGVTGEGKMLRSSVSCGMTALMHFVGMYPGGPVHEKRGLLTLCRNAKVPMKYADFDTDKYPNPALFTPCYYGAAVSYEADWTQPSSDLITFFPHNDGPGSRSALHGTRLATPPRDKLYRRFVYNPYGMDGTTTLDVGGACDCLATAKTITAEAAVLDAPRSPEAELLLSDHCVSNTGCPTPLSGALGRVEAEFLHPVTGRPASWSEMQVHYCLTGSLRVGGVPVRRYGQATPACDDIMTSVCLTPARVQGDARMERACQCILKRQAMLSAFNGSDVPVQCFMEACGAAAGDTGVYRTRAMQNRCSAKICRQFFEVNGGGILATGAQEMTCSGTVYRAAEDGQFALSPEQQTALEAREAAEAAAEAAAAAWAASGGIKPQGASLTALLDRAGIGSKQGLTPDVLVLLAGGSPGGGAGGQPASLSMWFYAAIATVAVLALIGLIWGARSAIVKRRNKAAREARAADEARGLARKATGVPS